MNKFYLNTFDNLTGTAMSVYSHARGTDRPLSGYYSVNNEYRIIFDVMCKEPVKAILYVNHDNGYIRDLAKLILPCKYPIEVYVNPVEMIK